MAGKIQLEGGLYQNFEGSPLAFGYLLVQLSHDGQETVDPGLINGAPKIRINLDGNGNIPLSPATNLWPNDQINPSGTTYTVFVYAADGTLVAGPQTWSLTSGTNPYNVANQVPAFPPGNGAGGAATQLLLETNGTPNTNQALFNLAAGTGISIANSSGTTTITNTNMGTSFSGNGAYFFGPGITDDAYVFGGIWSSFSATTANGTSTANQVVVYLFELQSSFTISSATVLCSNNTISQKASFGIYSFAGNKLVDAGQFSLLASAGNQTNTFTPVTLSPGTYWHAQTSTHANTDTFYGVPVGSNNNTNIVSIFVKNNTRAAVAANASSAGVLPATLGTLTPFTPTNSNTDGICSPLYE